MKIVCKLTTASVLTVILAGCSGFASVPTTNPTNVMVTAMSLVKTQAAMTQAAFPTATPIPPTPIPSDAYLNGQPSRPPADKLDYAMATAPKIYTRLPYINEATPYGEYSGCLETYDFHNFVGYPVMLPMESVNTAFLDYFRTEGWEFTEASSGSIGNDTSLPTIIFDVYRISSNEIPAFEKLKIVLADESLVRGENYVNVRAELTHVETKENLGYLLDPLYCYNNRSWWLWIRLTK